jgi:hypothetical protein
LNHLLERSPSYPAEEEKVQRDIQYDQRVFRKFQGVQGESRSMCCANMASGSHQGFLWSLGIAGSSGRKTV